jgi:hypothetical protein
MRSKRNGHATKIIARSESCRLSAVAGPAQPSPPPDHLRWYAAAKPPDSVGQIEQNNIPLIIAALQAYCPGVIFTLRTDLAQITVTRRAVDHCCEEL